MKKLLVYGVALATAMAASTFEASADELVSGYFLDNYVLNYKLNPALQPNSGTKGMVSLLVGNVDATVQSNLGISSFLFPVGDRLKWGFNKEVSTKEFLDKLKDVNVANVGAGVNLFTAGFRFAQNGFMTIEYNIKSSTSVNVPKELFAILKTGNNDTNEGIYSVRNLDLSNRQYGELALNCSYKFGNENQFSVGVGARLLMGLAQASAHIDQLDMRVMSNGAMVSAKGNIHASCMMLGYQSKDGYVDLSKLEYSKKIGFNGMGASFDLGFHWDSSFGLMLDAAVTNIGAIAWKNGFGSQFDFKEKAFSDNNQSIGKQLSEQIKLQPEGKNVVWMPVCATIGARYRMPFYRRLSVGLIGRMQGGDIKYYEVRGGVSCTPKDWFSVAVNSGWTSLGWESGVAMHFRANVLDFFLGMDGVPTLYGMGGIPVNRLNTTVKTGLIFTIGNKKMSFD